MSQCNLLAHISLLGIDSSFWAGLTNVLFDIIEGGLFGAESNIVGVDALATSGIPNFMEIARLALLRIVIIGWLILRADTLFGHFVENLSSWALDAYILCVVKVPISFAKFAF